MRFRFTALLIGLTAATAFGVSPPTESAPQLLSRKGGRGATPAELQKSAAAGDNAAAATLGEMLVLGNGVRRDVARGLPLLERGARAGDGNAAFRLGMMFENADGVEEDHARAVGYFRAAAAAGVAKGYFNVGAAYASGRGVRRDYPEALGWMILAVQHGAPNDAEQGIRTHCLNVQHREWITRGEARAPEIARELAAHPPAFFLPPAGPLVATEASPSGNRPKPGAPSPPRGAKSGPSGVVPLVNPPASRSELPLAAPTAPADEAGPPVNVMSINGRRLEWSSLEKLQREANHDLPEALFALGQLLLDGDKIPADPDRALVLLERGADAGNLDAAYRLADLYAHGRVVTQDDKRGFSYMLMAARHGARTAMHNVGAMYANGRGTAQNYTEALAWFTVAEKYGADFGSAGRIRDYLSSTSPEQLPIAQKRAAELEHEIDMALKGASS